MQVVALTEKPESTVRDACKREGAAELKICREEGAGALGMLKQMQAISAFTSKVSIIQMYDAVRLLRRLGMKELSTQLDQLRKTTEPPPLRNNTADAMRMPHSGIASAAKRSADRQLAVAARRRSGTGGLPTTRGAAMPGQATVVPPPSPPVPPAPPPPVQYIFPSSLPEVFLTPIQQVARYALADPSAELLVELGTYIQWCQAPINTERSPRYIKAAQTTSLEKVPSLVMAFMGATNTHFQLAPAEITMDMYKEPKYIARFLG